MAPISGRLERIRQGLRRMGPVAREAELRRSHTRHGRFPSEASAMLADAIDSTVAAEVGKLVAQHGEADAAVLLEMPVAVVRDLAAGKLDTTIAHVLALDALARIDGDNPARAVDAFDREHNHARPS